MSEDADTSYNLSVEVTEGPDPDAAATSAVHSFGYLMRPPVWLGGSLQDGSTEDVRAMWDRVAKADLPFGIRAWCFRNGLFVFNLAAWEPGAPAPAKERGDQNAIRERVRWRSNLLNTHLACLYTASKRRDRKSLPPILVAPSEVLNIQDDGAFGMTGELAGLGLVLARWTTRDGPPPVDDWRYKRPNTLSPEVLDDAYALLASILSGPGGDRVLPLIDLAQRSSVAHMNHSFDVSLIQSWAVIEALLTSIWERYLDSHRQRGEGNAATAFITADRKKLLTGRDYTIAIVTEVLSLLELLPPNLYGRLTEPRRARNRWMHTLRSVSTHESANSLALAFDLLRFVHAIDLDPAPDAMFGSGI